jgi:predicted nuclease of predicted toxin-antitoxin system
VLFLIDAQLPPSLVAALRDAGCDAVHVSDLGLLSSTDRQIWDEAMSRSAVLVTKDRDFPILRAASNDGPTVLWIRVGNTDNRTLIAQFLRALPAIIDAVERRETVIEFVGVPVIDSTRHI